MKKITKATFKKFLRVNEGKIFIKRDSDFDSSVDGVRSTGDDFKPAKTTEHNLDCTLGYADLWLVGDSRDYFSVWEDETFTGFHWHNCCGSGFVAIKK